MITSAYIHIPFCRQKCNYCSFLSFPDLTKKDAYISALKKQILLSYKGDFIKTLYFGGGTPSLLKVCEIDEIINLFQLDNDAEITLELNPETVDFEYFQALSKTRVNRLSIGVQSFNSEILKNIGRKHSVEDVLRAVENARGNGFDNISLDFIYGLPEQNSADFINDLKTACKLGVEHISLYGLKIDEGCYFYKNMPENLANEELQAEMYENAIKILKQEGFEHYEISNFARNGKYSRHNINYWQCGEYYGFGLGAHGYENKIRYANSTVLDDFIKNPTLKIENHKLSVQEMLEEKIFLGLRLECGINIKEINNLFSIDFEKKYEKILKKYLPTGYLVSKNGQLKLSTKGILVSNFILADFLD